MELSQDLISTWGNNLKIKQIQISNLFNITVNMI